MPLPLTVSCFSKIQIGFTFLVPAHPGSPGKRAVKRVCVCVHVRVSSFAVDCWFRFTPCQRLCTSCNDLLQCPHLWGLNLVLTCPIALSALTLLVGCQEEYVACKNLMMRCLHGMCLDSGARCRLFVYGLVDAPPIPKSIISYLSDIRIILPFCSRLTHIVLVKRLLNGCFM